VPPTTASPEELIQALGPIPAPLPPSSMQFGANLTAPAAESSSKRGSSRRGKQPRRQSTDALLPLKAPVVEEGSPMAKFQLGNFRPLAHDNYVPTASAHPSATVERRSPPHSHHSSPGPLRDGHSPSSAGSTEDVSPPFRTFQGQGSNYGPAAQMHSEPPRLPSIAATMPPPPRPAAMAGPIHPGVPTWRPAA
jgi:hypothetical protein